MTRPQFTRDRPGDPMGRLVALRGVAAEEWLGRAMMPDSKPKLPPSDVDKKRQSRGGGTPARANAAHRKTLALTLLKACGPMSVSDVWRALPDWSYYQTQETLRSLRKEAKVKPSKAGGRKWVAVE